MAGKKGGRKESLKELRNRTVAELKEMLDGEKGARQELFTARFRRATEKVENVHDIPAKRRQIARILTVINSKEAEAAKAKS